MSCFTTPLCFGDTEKDKVSKELQNAKELRNAIYYGDNSKVVVDLDKIKLLLEKGANPNWIDPESPGLPSTIGAWNIKLYREENNDTYQKGLEAIKLLFKHGAKLQYCDKTILFFPISGGKYELVKFYLDHGVSATFWPKEAIGGSDYNATPIIEATANGHEKIIELLVEYGAERLNEKKAIQIRFVEVAKHEDIDVLKKLIKKGAKVNTKNHDGETALCNALGTFYRYDTYIKVVYLLDIGANPNQLGGTQFSQWNTLPLHVAIYYSSFAFKLEKDRGNTKEYSKQILEELLKKGAHVSGRDEHQRTPLHIASQRDNIIAAKMLIDAGAKLMDEDNEGKTPLDYAESGEMIKLLKAHGAKE